MSKQFWRASLIRMARTIAQTMVAMISTTAVVLSDVDWKMTISASILAGILSILTSIATGLPEVDALDMDSLEAIDDEDADYGDMEEEGDEYE